MRGLSPVAASGGHSSLWCTGYSLRWPLLLWSTGSRRTGFSSCSTQASVVVARRLSSCGSWAKSAGSVVVTHRLSCSAACGILPQGLEPVSPALAGGFSTIAPPGKYRDCISELDFFVGLRLPRNTSERLLVGSALFVCSKGC